MPTTPASFDWVRRLVEQHTGNVLEDQKAYLVDSRLVPLARSAGLANVDELVSCLRSSRQPELEQQCIEAMLTHETSFFRDSHYFEALASDILPELIERRRSSGNLTIWCAACATGQEPYSLAMLIREQFSDLLTDWRLDFVASDLARPVIRQADEGYYSEVEIQRGLSPQRATRFFHQVDNRWVADQSLCDMIRFREVNLATELPPVSRVDLVLLRNVLIYMNEPTRLQVLQKVRHVLAPDGCLMLGATETLFDLDVAFSQNSGHVPTYRPSDD